MKVVTWKIATSTAEEAEKWTLTEATTAARTTTTMIRATTSITTTVMKALMWRIMATSTEE